MDGDPSPAPPTGSGAARRLLWLVAVVALVVGAGITATVFVVFGGDDDAAVIRPWVPPSASVPNGDRTLTSESAIQRYCLDRGGKQTVVVYFMGGDPDSDMRRAAGQLQGDERITWVRTETRQQAYQRFKEIFAEHPKLVELARPESLPASVTLLPADSVQPRDLADAVTAELPGSDSLGTGCEFPK